MVMKSAHMIWASVVIIFILVSGSVTLIILDKDVSVILTLAGIGAVGYRNRRKRCDLP